MAYWEAALEEQVRLMRWWRTPRALVYAEGFADDAAARLARDDAAFFRQTPQVEAAKLERADTVFVDRDVLELVDHARAAVRVEAMLPEDLFTPEGFALFERDVFLRDRNHGCASFRAMSWGPAIAGGIPRREELISGTHITLYAHWDAEDDYSVRLRASERRDHYLQAHGSLLSMFHAGFVPWGIVPTDEVTPELDHDRQLWRFVQTFFRFAQQEVVVPVRERGDRHARRRMARLREDRDGVLVVRLRRARPERKEPGDAEVEWSCRWPVSGHWRDQWYPSVGAHRQKWIHGYVKGPADKPLRTHAGRAFIISR